MIEHNSPEPESKYRKFVKYFSLIMTLIYPAVGIYLLVSSPKQVQLDPTAKIALGIMLIFYGLYRGYRIYRNTIKPPRRPDYE